MPRISRSSSSSAKKPTAKKPSVSSSRTSSSKTTSQTSAKKTSTVATSRKTSSSKASSKSSSSNRSSGRTVKRSFSGTPGNNLVIVESPTKAKTISGFLGKEYDVVASLGHIADLPQKQFGVDLTTFDVEYEIPPEKKTFVKELKKVASQAKRVYLATDEDREGEAISANLIEFLGLPSKTPRIVFHEITKDAIHKALASPRVVDEGLVHAQQSRRVVDRLVGFKVSPLLWSKIKMGLSAGRVQSVATKLIVEREREILAFVPEEFWKIKTLVEDITFSLSKIDGKEATLRKGEETKDFLTSLGFSCQNESEEEIVSSTAVPFVVEKIDQKEGSRNPSAPYTTSSLQQEASRRLGWTVKQVMSVAQKLYEKGYITYMRTDSTNLSSQALGQIAGYIKDNFGEKYLQFRTYSSKKGAQEAHEAIRPTNFFSRPTLEAQEKKLYDMIFNRAVMSQMASAKLLHTTITGSIKNSLWTAKGEEVLFDGFFAISRPDDIEPIKKLSPGTYKTSETLATQSFTSGPARYTESSLVKTLESLGIGRPSTYAPTISTIQDRGYVELVEKKLRPTDIAFVVTDYLDANFPDVMNYEFTATMEEELDEISEGDHNRKEMVKEFWKKLSTNIEKAKKSEFVVTSDKVCSVCGGAMIVKFSGKTKFYGCQNYPTCTHTERSETEDQKLTLLRTHYEGQPCPKGGTIVVKTSRFGPFLASSEYPQVKWSRFIPDEKFIEMDKQIGSKKCPNCVDGTLYLKRGRRGYFLACDNYPDCQTIENLPGQEKPRFVKTRKLGVKKSTRKKAVS